MRKKIAIVGSGISGLTAAWLLSRQHEVTLFEAESRPGGHTYTVDVAGERQPLRVDMGFIVFNDRTYPNFNRLLAQLGVGQQKTSMGFSVSDRGLGLEYCGDGIGGVFAQKRNWLSLAHWRMVRDILRFNREALDLLDTDSGDIPLARYLRDNGYSERFLTHYILPMGGAIWSCSDAQMENFPARFFVRFFHHHGLLSLTNRPQWYVVPGGSRSYVDALLARCPVTLKVDARVTGVRREAGGVRVEAGALGGLFDDVVLACHADQSLVLLQDADIQEEALLSSVPYQGNEVVLHTDERLLPRNRRCWSSWNATLMPQASPEDPVEVTYNMNILQQLDSPRTWCVTLNARTPIDPQAIHHRTELFHPVFTPDGITLRDKLAPLVNGRNKVWFCGAWLRNGFHEDGVVSALRVAEQFGESL